MVGHGTAVPPGEGGVVPRFSHSAIESFRSCPRQYYYRYVARVKLPDVPEQIAPFFGSRAHDALEWLYRRAMNGVLSTREELLGEFDRLWEEKWDDSIVIDDAEMSGEMYQGLGRRCLSDYYGAHHPFDDSTTVALEQRVDFELDEGIAMIGFIDRLAKSDDGVWHIHDYKTNKRLPTQGDMDRNPQLAYYEIGIRSMWPTIDRVELHWHYLRFGETITSTRTGAQLEELRDKALGTIRDATGRGQDEDRFETVESGLCRYCDYQSICPVTKHGYQVSELPSNRYLEEPGVKLVNRWAELKASKAELDSQVDALDEEIGEVKEALAAYAEREDLSAVVGDEFEATVRNGKRVVFPRKTVEPEEHTALEEQLVQSPFWSLVSSMDASQLRALWNDQESLDPRLKAVLERYVRVECETKVGLRKRRSC